MSTTSPQSPTRPSNVAARGYVLVRTGAKPSAIVPKDRALHMRRRFGGRIILAKGLRYRTVRGMRVVLEADLPEVAARVAAGQVLA